MARFLKHHDLQAHFVMQVYTKYKKKKNNLWISKTMNRYFEWESTAPCCLNELILSQNTGCWPTDSTEREKSVSVQTRHITDLQPLFGQLSLRLPVLTVLGVCVAECVLAVCVAAVVVVDLAGIRSLILFRAELVRGRSAERVTADITYLKMYVLTNI